MTLESVDSLVRHRGRRFRHGTASKLGDLFGHARHGPSRCRVGTTETRPSVAENNIKAGLFRFVGPASRKSKRSRQRPYPGHDTIRYGPSCFARTVRRGLFGSEERRRSHTRDDGSTSGTSTTERSATPRPFTASGLGRATILAGNAAKTSAALETFFGR